METIKDPSVSQRTISHDPRVTASPGWVMTVGYVLLAISAALYAVEEYSGIVRTNDNLTVFFVHYFLAIAYVIILGINKAYGFRRSWHQENIHKTVILLNLFLVSSYALNRSMNVFEDSVNWLCAYLLLSSTALLSFSFFSCLPKAVNRIQQLLLGSAMVLYVYLAVYVANFYILGFIGIIVLGIGIHIFTPLILFVLAIRLQVLTHRQNRTGYGWLVVGIIIPILIMAGFLVEWKARVRAIDRLSSQVVLQSTTDVPVWVNVARNVKNDWITHRILKSRMVYTLSNGHFNGDFFRWDSDWDERRRHDPLVFLAGDLSSSSLSDTDRINILKALTDGRHRSETRLWSGNDLITSNIVTDADIYPNLRIAYTEYYFNIRNTSLRQRWDGNRQEALYSFDLPEGSVVTSLSLWINGVEEKGILTSKAKASEAYTTIVGTEARDPSVVHWQEGNTVTVRVFPCTVDEERKFKLGVSSPLIVKDDKLIYKDITFKGPVATDATQTMRIRVVGNGQDINLPNGFKKNLKGEYIREGVYDGGFEIEMDRHTIPSNHFAVGGFSYSVKEVNVVPQPVHYRQIYFDINNSWTLDDIRSLRPMMGKTSVSVFYDNEFLQLSEDNYDEVTSVLQKNNFSLFPFYLLKDTNEALVVSKGKQLSPHLTDLKNSNFAAKIGKYFLSGRKVRVFNLGPEASTIVRSLRELRGIEYASGNVADLHSLVDKSLFPAIAESGDRVVIHDAKIAIERQAVKTGIVNDAPDHLARLFAYNNIMRQLGTNFFREGEINQALVDEAARAYVVSPVSSLIVLESQKDYDRFGIKDIDDTLGNASKNSSGAVPEPHEWALIVLFLVLIIYYVINYRRNQWSSLRRC